MKTLIGKFNENLLALLVFTLIFLFSIGTAFGQQEKRVVIKGRLSLPPGNTNTAYACLVASDGEEMEVAIGRNGKFWIDAPQNERYTLSFTQEGSYGKDVVVDTHNAGKSINSRKKREIAFDVVLTDDNSDRRLHYDGAVGSIDFHKSNGRMRVKRHYQLVNGEQPMLAESEVK